MIRKFRIKETISGNGRSTFIVQWTFLQGDPCWVDEWAVTCDSLDDAKTLMGLMKKMNTANIVTHEELIHE